MNKKNYFWSMLTMTMVAMLSVAFVSCSSDDDDKENGSTNSIVGTWEMTNVQGYLEDKETGQRLNFNVNPGTTEFEDLDVADYVRFEFGSDNKMKAYEWGNNTWHLDSTIEYRYDAASKILTIAPWVAGKEVKIKVVSLDNTKLVIESTEEDEDEKLYVKGTFKKV